MAATEREPPVDGGHLIKRPRLTRILDASNARIILLVAPAGYGKTTLAREWLEGKPHVWYRASSADADVAALAVGLASAAAELVPGVDRRIKQRVRAVRDPEREAAVLAEFVAEDLDRLADDTWLAIDDYQFIGESVAGDRFLGELVEAARLPLLVTSRTRPSWSTARGVVYGGTTTLGRDELEMTDAEVRATVGRTRAEVPTLFENATGWPAIVGLAARVGPERLEGHELPDDLHDFFAEELWRFLDEETRWQLSRLALVAPISKDVAEAIVGDSALALLEGAMRAGWLTSDRNDVVIHPLLARFLRQRFEKYSARLRYEAIRNLIEVLTTEGEWDQAMALALDADGSAVPSVFEQSLEVLLSRGRLPTIERWLQSARDHGIDAPVLSLAAAEVSFRRGDCVRAESLARLAATGPGSSAFRVRSLNVAGRSARRNARLETSLDLHRQARAIADDDASLREAVVGEILAALDVGLPDVELLLRHLPPDDGSALDRLRRAVVEAWIALRQGRVHEAIVATAPLGSLVRDIDDPLARTSFWHVRAHLLTAAGEYREGRGSIVALEADAAEYRVDFALTEALLLRATAEAGLRNFVHARRLIRECLSSIEGAGDIFEIANAASLEARIEVASHSGSVPTLRSGLEGQACVGVYPEYLLSIALAEAAFGSAARATSLKNEATKVDSNAEVEVLAGCVEAALDPTNPGVVSAAFELALDRGFVDRFVVTYRGSPKIVETLARQTRFRDELTAIMRRANDLEIAERLGLTDVASVKRSRLTRRQREVYGLMVDGLSNRAIAQRLFITEPTAKLHVRHILGKLSARSRAEAVAKWQDVLGDL